MKRITWAVYLFLLLVLAAPARAQMGTDFFTRPAILKAFHPTVGKGAEYLTTTKVGNETKTSTMQLGVVGKESVEGKDAYWLQSASADDKGQPVFSKILMSFEGEVNIHRLIVQQPGQPAMEMPMNVGGARHAKLHENLNEWHSLGTESVTVPAGTFSCEHWKNDKDGSEIWTSEKVPGSSVVKEVSKGHTMVLAKVLNDYPDRITGPVKKFDLQEMMQQMQQQHQHP